MYFEITSKKPLRFAAQDLNQEEAEMLANALIEIKTKRFNDASKFEHERKKCVDMYNKIDTELVNAKRPERPTPNWEDRHLQLVESMPEMNIDPSA